MIRNIHNLDDIMKCQVNFLEFLETVFFYTRGTHFKKNGHIIELCRILEDVFLGKKKRVIINVPPRSGKTEIAVINFIAWCLGFHPDSEFIHVSYSKRLAASNAYQIRKLVRSDAYRYIFPWVKVTVDSSARDEFRTIQGGCVYAVGSGGTITGYGAGKMREGFGGAIIIDDPHKASEANSKLLREKVLEWYHTTLESRKNTVDTPIIVIQQRLHEKDLSGFLESGGSLEEWDVFRIPAITKKGQSFWPEMFPMKELNRLKNAEGYRFSGQYMQRPAPIGGNIFKYDWLNFYENKPSRFKYRVIYVDTAQKTKDWHDYSVFQCWGVTKENNLFLLDMIRGRWDAPTLLRRAVWFYEKMRNLAERTEKGMAIDGPLIGMKIEDKSSGIGLIQQLRHKSINVKEVPRTVDKITRAFNVAPYIESGHVFIPAKGTWLNDFVVEYELFPNAEHDDIMDPMMDAIEDTYINPETYSFKRLGLI